MILTDIHIRAEIDAGRVVFDPPLSLDGPDAQLHTSTMDLRLGETLRSFRSFTTGLIVQVDPAHPEFDIIEVLDALTEPVANDQFHSDDFGRYYEWHGGVALLASTLERVTIPHHLSGRVEGRSSLARLGVTVHNTAPYVHPGFSDYITLELHYSGKIPFRLRPGLLRICQLILENVATPPLEPYPGAYARQ